IALDALLIPSHGAGGAAAANSTAQLLGATAVVVYAHSTISLRNWHFSVVGRSAVAAVARGAAAVAVLSLIGGIPGMLIGFGVFCLRLGFLVRVPPLFSAVGRHLRAC